MKQPLCIIVLAAALCGAGAASAQGAWQPEHNIEIIVGSSPGTGTDIAHAQCRLQSALRV